MALVETRQLPEGKKFEQVSQVVRAMRGAIGDECSAQNLYDEIIEHLEQSSIPDRYNFIDCVKHIRDEEIQHTGMLLAMISRLDNHVAEELQKGAEK